MASFSTSLRFPAQLFTLPCSYRSLSGLTMYPFRFEQVCAFPGLCYIFGILTWPFHLYASFPPLLLIAMSSTGTARAAEQRTRRFGDICEHQSLDCGLRRSGRRCTRPGGKYAILEMLPQALKTWLYTNSPSGKRGSFSFLTLKSKPQPRRYQIP